MQIELNKDEISMVYNSISARLLYYKDNIKKLSEEIDKVEAGTLVFSKIQKKNILLRSIKNCRFIKIFAQDTRPLYQELNLFSTRFAVIINKKSILNL